jgi:hypothetical protein
MKPLLFVELSADYADFTDSVNIKLLRFTVSFIVICVICEICGFKLLPL